MKHYLNKEYNSIQKFIDREHNLLFFKTRNPESLKTIDKFKLGNDMFLRNFFFTFRKKPYISQSASII